MDLKRKAFLEWQEIMTRKDFRPNEENLARLREKERKEEELLQKITAEIGGTSPNLEHGLLIISIEDRS
jgi:hypothetical protein